LQRLPDQIKERNEKLKDEMLGKSYSELFYNQKQSNKQTNENTVSNTDSVCTGAFDFLLRYTACT